MSNSNSSCVIACLQTEPEFGAVEANLDAVESAIDGLTADLLVLPELFATGYSFRERAELLEYAETFPESPTVKRMAAWSAKTGGMIVGGYVERDGDNYYNAAAVVANGESLDSYRKIHLFGFEFDIFDAGDRPFPVHECNGLRVGTMICFDWIYPEAARALALQGADVIAHPSNLVLPGWCQRAMRIRAMENHVFTITANRAGREHRPPRGELQFTGVSRIVGPVGEVLADAPAEGWSLLTLTIDPGLARDKRVPSGNDLFVERRPEWYAGWAE